MITETLINESVFEFKNDGCGDIKRLNNNQIRVICMIYCLLKELFRSGFAHITMWGWVKAGFTILVNNPKGSFI
jgi:hypothetical protein